MVYKDEMNKVFNRVARKCCELGVKVGGLDVNDNDFDENIAHNVFEDIVVAYGLEKVEDIINDKNLIFEWYGSSYEFYEATLEYTKDRVHDTIQFCEDDILESGCYDFELLRNFYDFNRAANIWKMKGIKPAETMAYAENEFAELLQKLVATRKSDDEEKFSAAIIAIEENVDYIKAMNTFKYGIYGAHGYVVVSYENDKD